MSPQRVDKLVCLHAESFITKVMKDSFVTLKQDSHLRLRLTAAAAVNWLRVSRSQCEMKRCPQPEETY